jgi:hypothetical protein
MKPRPKPPLPTEKPVPSGSDPDAIMQIKVWLLGISPMVWRRVLVPSGCTLGELHGVFQVAMGWGKRWPGSSRHRCAAAKWNLCRLVS